MKKALTTKYTKYTKGSPYQRTIERIRCCHAASR